MDEETKKRIAEIRAREQKATVGCWYAVNQFGRMAIVKSGSDAHDPQQAIVGHYGMRDNDAEFIAHARQDVPFLLDALEKSDANFETGLIASSRRALCDVLERLGADGAWYWRSDMTVEDLHGEIVRFARENETMAITRQC